MNKDSLWKIYTDKNPQFLEGTIKFTPKGLKDFFDQTFEQGVKHGKGGSSSNYKKPDPPKEPSFDNDVVNNLFKIFNGGK